MQYDDLVGVCSFRYTFSNRLINLYKSALKGVSFLTAVKNKARFLVTDSQTTEMICKTHRYTEAHTRPSSDNIKKFSLPRIYFYAFCLSICLFMALGSFCFCFASAFVARLLFSSV